MTEQAVLPRKTRSGQSETLSLPARLGEMVGVALMIGLYTFLRAHQSRNTGFFTEDFGTLEQLSLYGPLFLGLSPLIVRAATGRRNPARPFEIATSLALTAGSLWLLISFPFEFSHLADFLPGGLRFLLAWVTNTIGRIPLIIQVIIGPISAVWHLVKFLRVAGAGS